MHTRSRIPPGHRKTLPLLTGYMLFLLPVLALSYEVFSYTGQGGETLYLKWGDNNAGTPGGVITWSFIPAGTSGDAMYCGDACPGTSVSSINIENSPGTGYTLTPLTELEASITEMMNRWAAAADITFVKLPSDTGVAINDPSAIPDDTGHIRIGVFHFLSGGGAVGYAPPPNGGTGAGDIIFDANSFYAFQPGNEGDPFPGASTAPNDFETLLLHELGHAAIGLAHPPFDGSCPVMQTDISCFGTINRELDQDDIDGARFLYGAADTDGDGVADDVDNCRLVPNTDQCNTNAGGDNFGNICDADLDNNDTINSFDLSIMRSNFGQMGINDADLDCNGIVNTFDLTIMRESFGLSPGPGAN